VYCSNPSGISLGAFSVEKTGVLYGTYLTVERL